MNFILRKAIIEDSDFLFNLRNEESVRKASFNNNWIVLEDHRKWFQNKLASNQGRIFIAEIVSKPIAMIRFDLIGGVEAEVNIAVTEKFQGKGYGSEILRQSAVKFLETFPKVKLIHALIKLDNLASIRSFGKAGYQTKGETNHKGMLCLEMVLSR